VEAASTIEAQAECEGALDVGSWPQRTLHFESTCTQRGTAHGLCSFPHLSMSRCGSTSVNGSVLKRSVGCVAKEAGPVQECGIDREALSESRSKNGTAMQVEPRLGLGRGKRLGGVDEGKVASRWRLGASAGIIRGMAGPGSQRRSRRFSLNLARHIHQETLANSSPTSGARVLLI
jgi:hypothetical protein